jgi:MFS family permease
MGAVEASPAARARHLGFWHLLAINAFKFGGDGAHWAPISFVLLPVGAALVAGNGAALVIARSTSAGAVFAVLVPVLVGYLSDRTASRYGRRRPWMVAGTILNLVGLGLMALAGSVPALIGAFLLIQISNNGAFAAYSAVIPDVVPSRQNGQASGLLNGMQQLGTVVGLAVIQLLLTALGSSRSGLIGSYLVIALLAAGSLLVSVAAIPEKPLERVQRAAAKVSQTALIATVALAVAVVSLEAVLLGYDNRLILVVFVLLMVIAGIVAVVFGAQIPEARSLVAPLAERDFFWVLTTRFFNTFGVYVIAPFIALYFRDVVGSKNFGADSALWLLAVIGGGILPAVFGGYLSDRAGRRKIFVYIASGTQALVSLVLVFTLIDSAALLYVLGVIFGLGFGAYQAVDWALACDVLPDKERAAAKDMALFHVSLTLPQVLGPAIFGVVLFHLNREGGNLGYRIVFASAAVWFILATIFVSRIKGVR